jgi:hypothetical protein
MGRIFCSRFSNERKQNRSRRVAIPARRVVKAASSRFHYSAELLLFIRLHPWSGFYRGGLICRDRKDVIFSMQYENYLINDTMHHVTMGQNGALVDPLVNNL